MVTLVLIIIYVLIGAALGFKDREIIDAIFNKHDKINKLSEGQAIASSVIATIGILLTAPMIQLFIVIRKLKHLIRG